MEADLQKIILEIAQKENIKSPKITTTNSPTSGYVANVNKITIQDGTSDKVLKLFVKKMPKDVREDFKHLFIHEAEFYSKIMKAFAEIIPKNSKLSVPLVPKTYYAECEYLIMDDLFETNYKVWEQLKDPMDTEHIKAVMKAYGKFHAFSFALKHKDKKKFESMGTKYDWFIHNHERMLSNGFYTNLVDKMTAGFDAASKSKYREACTTFMRTGFLKYLEEMQAGDHSNVYVHGDCWAHNFLFRYNDAKKLTDVCLLDFQLSSRSPPVIDLGYFLCTCGCSNEVFDSIWDYMKIYHESLQSTLKALDCPGDLYSWEAFKRDWQKYSLKGFVMSSFVSKMLVSDKDELEAVKHIELPLQFDFISRHEKLYQERMKVMIKYFCDNGMINEWI